MWTLWVWDSGGFWVLSKVWQSIWIIGWNIANATDYLLKGIEPVQEKEHKTVGDILEQKILTEDNGKRTKKILKYIFYVFLGVLGVDLVSLIIYLIVNGIPKWL